MRAILIVFLALLLAGCARESQESTIGDKKKKSSVQTLLDGATGRTAVRAGRKAEKTLRQVSADQQRELEEVLGK